jgi:pimeloyl-ACP methyl ester carboxylesterase
VSFAEIQSDKGQNLAAAFGYRAAEFLTHPTAPDKLPLYDLFYEHFYAAVPSSEMNRISVPYQNTTLPALRFTPEINQGTIILHGGLDSFMEEFFSIANYISQAGYDVILFEGPGQGFAHRKNNLYMTYQWEQPVSTILDHFEVTDVTLVGISMGGFLAPRAAAFDKRITRLVAYDIATFDLHGSGLQGKIYQFFVNNPGVYNRVAKMAMRRSVQADHLINQWMFVTGAKTPAEWNEQLQNYSVSDVADKVDQDVLLLAGEKDHLVPLKEYHITKAGLPHARSITGRIFTETEHAHNHCQIGNIQLALDTILQWISNKTA